MTTDSLAAAESLGAVLEAASSRPFSLGWLSFWTVVWLAVTGATWQAAGLKGRFVSAWANRVRLVEAGLSERAMGCLRRLRNAADELLVAEEDFDPLMVIADPARIKNEVQDFLETLEVRQNLKGQFDSLLSLSKVIVVSLVGMWLGVTLAALMFSAIADERWIRVATIVIGTPSVAALVASFFRYTALQDWLANAELRSSDWDGE